MPSKKRWVVLSVLVAVGLAGSTYVSLVAYSSLTDSVAKATVLAALIAFFGVIFTPVYSEISSYYKERAQAAQAKIDAESKGLERKWELIFPLLMRFYNPWIQCAKYLSGYLSEIKNATPFSSDQASRVMFYMTLFFSVRLQLSYHGGGVPILAKKSDEDSVMTAYRNLLPKLDWIGRRTRTDVSFLQEYFISRDRPKKPYLAFHFLQDIDDPKSPPDLARIRSDILGWLTKKNCEDAATALNEFIREFEKAISHLYEGWLTNR